MWEKYVKLINHADKSDEEKIGLLFNVIRRRRYKNSELNEHIVEILKKHEFGRNFLTRLEGNRTQIKKGTENKAHTQLKTVKETNTSREVRIKNGMKQLQKTSVKTDTNLKSRGEYVLTNKCHGFNGVLTDEFMLQSVIQLGKGPRPRKHRRVL